MTEVGLGKWSTQYLDRQIDAARIAAVDTWQQARNSLMFPRRLQALNKMARGHERHAATLEALRNRAQIEAHNPEGWQRSQRRTSPGLLGRTR